MSDFSHNLIRFRKARRWSQEQLAEHSGISVRTIQRIENSTSQPRNHTLKTLARVFDTTIDDLTAPTQAEEQQVLAEILRKLNASALLLIILPFGNLIAPYALWLRYKNNQGVKDAFQTIISFHLLWTVITFLLLALTPVITQAITGSVALGRFPLIFTLYYVLVIINSAIVIKSAQQLGQNNTQIYGFVPKIL